MTEADLSEESDMAAWREERGRCKRPAPPAVPGRGGQRRRVEGEQAVIVHVPASGGLFPMELVEAIRDLDEHVLVGLVPYPHHRRARLSWTARASTSAT
jgi:hypothetical protein